MTFSSLSDITSNLDEYADPELYDVENPEAGPAGQFFLTLAQTLGGPALELGCGTGRMTIPLAQQGIDSTGLDVVPGMLALARDKSAGLPVRWVEADARTFQLGRRFRLIFDYTAAFQHVLERADHEAILTGVRDHLEPEGRFVLVAMFPQPGLMTTLAEHEWFSYTDPQGREVRVSGTVDYDHVRQIYHENAIRRWRDEAGQEVVKFAPLARRLFFPQELEALLHYNGFTAIERYGDWDRSPLTEDSTVMIFVCQKQ